MMTIVRLISLVFIVSNYVYASITNDLYQRQVNLFQNEFSADVYEVYGKSLRFKLWDAEGKAFVQCRSDLCEIITFSSFLESHTINQLNALLCHEIGHLLGEKHTNNSILSNIYSSTYAVEGEADYFSTSVCLKRITNLTNEELKVLAYNAIEMTAHGPPLNINGENPYRRDLELGTNMSYPSADCRFATLVAGIKLIERPSCWFVPNELIPFEYRKH